MKATTPDSNLKFRIAVMINKIRSIWLKCALGHAWMIENLTDRRGRTLRMQRRCIRCRQRQLLTVKRNADGSQKLYWFRR